MKTDCCKNCNKIFEHTSHDVRKYCSKICVIDFKYKNLPEVVCKGCGIKYKKYAHKNRVYCSEQCQYKHQYKFYKGLPILDNSDNILCYLCMNYLPQEKFRHSIKTEYTQKRNGCVCDCKNCEIVYRKISKYKHTPTILRTLKARLGAIKSSKVSREIYVDPNLTLKDLETIYDTQMGLCAISGEKMAVMGRGKKSSTTISVDRIDSNKGYTKDNIQLVCWIVNMMKSEHSTKDLINWCQKVVNYNQPIVRKSNFISVIEELIPLN